MAAIVLPNVVRYAIHQTLAGRDVVNIVDMNVVSTAGGPSREDAVHDVAGDIINNWSDHILQEQVDNLVAQSISWVDLDSANGSVGSRSSTDAQTWPKAGGLESPTPLPGMVSLRVLKNTTGGRQARKGRMYLAGFDDGKTADDPNRWLPAFVSGMNGKMQQFLDGISDAGVANVVERFPVVIHTPDGTAPSATPVTSYTVDPVLATQRRRTRG